MDSNNQQYSLKSFGAEGTEVATKISIVVVEDHEVVRQGISAAVSAQSDMEIVGACGTANEALPLILEKRPHIVLSDLAMPGMSPFDMMKSVRSQLPRARFIMLTALISDTNLARALDVGVSGVMTKAESLVRITAAIRDVAADKSFFSEEILPRVQQLTSTESGSRPILSPREIEVLCCVARGLSAKEVASMLSISAKTVERHKSNIMTKLNMHSQVDLTRYAIKEGLIHP